MSTAGLCDPVVSKGLKNNNMNKHLKTLLIIKMFKSFEGRYEERSTVFHSLEYTSPLTGRH